jgi:hypothetical protein
MLAPRSHLCHNGYCDPVCIYDFDGFRRYWGTRSPADRRHVTTVDETELSRSFAWYCSSCQQGKADLTTNITALRHASDYPGHVVFGSGMATFKFEASIIDQLATGRQVENVSLPGPALPDGGTGESLE